MITALAARLGRHRVLTAREDILPYGFDGTATLKQLPACVVFQRDADDASFVLKIAREHRVPVITRGSGTGLSGGSVLCLVKMYRILEVDTANLTLRAVATWPPCSASARTAMISPSSKNSSRAWKRQMKGHARADREVFAQRHPARDGKLHLVGPRSRRALAQDVLEKRVGIGSRAQERQVYRIERQGRGGIHRGGRAIRWLGREQRAGQGGRTHAG